MEQQRNWLEFFEKSKRQRDARLRFLEGLPAPRPVIELLQALDDLAQVKGARVLEDGTVELSVPIQDIAQQLGVTRNTAKRYIGLAGDTPYLAGDLAHHRSHTYRINWPAVVDDSRSGEANTVGGCTATRSQATGQERGSFRGSDLTPSGGQAGGQSDPLQGGQRGGQLEASSLTPSKAQGFRTPGFYETGISNSKAPGLKAPGAAGGLQLTPSAGRCVRGDPDRDFPLLPLKQGFWTRWKAALDATNFGDAAEVQRLYEFALSELPADRFPDSEANRRNVFAQATKEVRMNAGGRFIRENVPRLRWFAANEDYDRAAQMITTLDARAEVVDQLPRPPRTPTEARRRDDEIIRLQHALREFVHDKTTEEITEAFELPEHVAAALLEWRTWSHVRNDDLRHLTLRIIAAQVGVTAGAQ